MRIRNRLILLVLALCMLLSACSVAAAETEETVAAPETEAAAETPAFLDNLHYQPKLSDTVLPEKDEATGTLVFYLNDSEIYAGAPVADLIEVGFFTYTDLTETLQPWHMSGVIRAQIEMDDVEFADEPYIFFVAMNASDEPRMISECLIYSITVTYQANVSFGSGNEKEPFVTGVTKREEIEKAYGEPTELISNKNRSTYEELFYYQPFNSVSFMFKDGVLKQVNSYYSANVYGALAEGIDFELTASAMENDALIFMSQYMDMTPYLPEKAPETDTDEKVEEEKKEVPATLTALDDGFQLDGNTIKLGSKVSELPSPFNEALNGLTMPIHRNYYVRTGRDEPEEFFLINNEGQSDMKSDNLVIKGVIVENPNYCNWGFDNSGFHSFNCMGVTENSTIDDVLELFGEPGEMLCSSGERTCFIWMHYKTEEGDYLHIRVDPMLNQVIEVHMVKHFENEHKY